MKEQKKEKYGSKKQIALVNSITGLRFFASFSIIPLFKFLGGTAASIFAGVFFLTDWIDGFLARKFKASTFFGSFFDGLSDKTFSMIIFALMMTVNPLVFSIPLLLELGIILAQANKAKKGLNVKSNMIGKVKTCFLSVTAACSLLVSDLLNMPAFIDYIKNASLASVSNIKDALLLLGINIPTIVMQILTLRSYKKEAEDAVSDDKINCKDSNDIEDSIKQIQEEKRKLQEEYTLLEKTKIFNNMLFDPECYEQNKDEKISVLVRKLFDKSAK